MRISPAPLSIAAATLALGAALAGCSDSDTTPTADSGDRSTSSAPSTDAGTSPNAPASSSAPEGSGAVTVPVYYVGDTPEGPRLFREFHRVSGDPLAAAAALITDGTPDDPDYRTLFPGGTFTSVAVEDGTIVATAADRSWQTPGTLTEDEGALAVQQLVYTLQGVLQQRLPLEVRVDGQADFLFGFDTAGGATNAAPLKTLGLVNITSPEEGAQVGDTLTASGVASSFEATVPWRILDADGTAVLTGSATAEGWVDKLYPWRTDIDVSSLPAGSYVFEASTDDPSGGEGPGPTTDTKDFTVS